MRDAEEQSGGVVSLCSLKVDGRWFGIDTRQVWEVLGDAVPQRVPLAPEYIAGVVSYRGEVLTTVSFRTLLGVTGGDGQGCVLVLDDEGEERFGLLVDGVGGVLEVKCGSLEENPRSLDVRSMELFDGTYRTDEGLIVHLDPRRLRPVRLAEAGLFETATTGGGTR